MPRDELPANAGRPRDRSARRDRRAAWAVVAAWLVVLAVTSPVEADSGSSYWDEVREPSLRRYREMVEQAREALDDHRVEDGVGLARAATEVLPDRAEAWVVLGRGLFQGAGFDEAAAAFERALAIDPAVFDPDALGNVTDGARAARLAAQAGSWDLARRVLERILGLMAPGAVRRDLYALYANVLLTLGPEHLADAVAAYREVIRGSSRPDVDALLGLALALRRQGATTEPFDLAREAAAHGSVEARLRSVLAPEGERAARSALALEAIGDLEGARRAWEEAAHGPWREHARVELARLER